mmetsp:Transcript_33781/g.40806  ORF Transcript_33781/g.40806 Transcript_33781/m.40806 type:complete len:87 (+) Transcript_33781:663-923(+)
MEMWLPQTGRVTENSLRSKHRTDANLGGWLLLKKIPYQIQYSWAKRQSISEGIGAQEQECLMTDAAHVHKIFIELTMNLLCGLESN